MVVLIDTNVALDFLTVRQPFYQSAKAILQACASDDMQGYIAFHSLTNAGLIRSMTGCCTTVSCWTTGPHGTIRRLPSAVPA